MRAARSRFSDKRLDFLLSARNISTDSFVSAARRPETADPSETLRDQSRHQPHILIETVGHRVGRFLADAAVAVVSVARRSFDVVHRDVVSGYNVIASSALDQSAADVGACPSIVDRRRSELQFHFPQRSRRTDVETADQRGEPLDAGDNRCQGRPAA